ncbi:hypothetical protein HDU96_003587 [Phlyctochytrium bullatum]|nr:hypothetical protein HDU96_003587 [Phlyctochytrium bullatum]
MPFIQYDIHRQLVYKLRIYGLNSIFGLRIQISVGESLIVALATGTGLYVTALPQPPALKVSRNRVPDEEDKNFAEIQKKIVELSESNRRQIEGALQRRNSGEFKDRSLVRRQNGSRRDTISRIADDISDVVKAMPSNALDSDSDTSTDSDGDPDTLNKQKGIVVQIDDEQDEDLVLLLDPAFGDDFQLRNVDTFLGGGTFQYGNVQMINMVKLGNISSRTHRPNRQLAALFKSVYQELQAQLWYLGPCIIGSLSHTVQLLKSNDVQIRLTAAVLAKLPSATEPSGDDEKSDDFKPPDMSSVILDTVYKSPGTPGPSAVRQNTMASLGTNASDDLVSDSSGDELVFSIDEEEVEEVGKGAGKASSLSTRDPSAPADTATNFAETEESAPVNTRKPELIELTPLSSIPHAKIERFLGRISLHFVKESSVLFEPNSPIGGMGGFSHVFLCELHALVRSHTEALGGNALLSFNLDYCIFAENIKNQGYSLLSISGDVVHVSYNYKTEERFFTKPV